ncbi:ABC transporter permease [Patescibacteria group bacterium]|nr:ABC transporter permease [Patescibacteria group bacterium]
MSVIYILWLRQVKKFFRNKYRIIGSLANPILLLVAFGFGFGPIFERAGGGNYINFLAPGIIAQGILFTSIFTGMELIWDKQFGFLKESLVAPVSRFNIMIGRTVGGATIATFQGLLILFISLLVGFRPNNWINIIPAIIIMFITAVLFSSIGTAIACKLDDHQGFQLIMNFLILPLFFLSGALFPLQDLPTALQFISAIDPLSYTVDALRYFLSSGTHFGITTSLSVMVILSVIALWIGGELFKKIKI